MENRKFTSFATREMQNESNMSVITLLLCFPDVSCRISGLSSYSVAEKPFKCGHSLLSGVSGMIYSREATKNYIKKEKGDCFWWWRTRGSQKELLPLRETRPSSGPAHSRQIFGKKTFKVETGRTHPGLEGEEAGNSVQCFWIPGLLPGP